jgi:TolB-like protein/tRNA A-37 threonylcarbamoyl transferase component Bud32/thioredoxin-like negative regulator of GroEL
MSSPAGSVSLPLKNESGGCVQCGSASRVGRGLCLNCLLSAGVDSNGDHPQAEETLDDLLSRIHGADADWLLGNYQILEEIGRGGMGVIYRARQRHSRRIVALKRILSCHADSRETLMRFRREAQAAAKLDHPNILPIYEVSQCEDGLPFFSMKFAGGGSLLEAVPALRSEPRRAVALMAKVARALQYAHDQGILHRDLKPGNILLDGHSEPLVSDFGLAKWLEPMSDLTRTPSIFGTPGYIAPEQMNASASKLTPAADVYGLGAILFHLLTGRPPFIGEHALKVIQQANEKPAPKLRTLAPGLDRDLETISARCLEPEPSARYSSAGALAEDLERWLEGRHIIARPVSPPARIWRWSRRNPIVAGMAALLLTLGMAVGVLIWKGEVAPENGDPPAGIAVLPFESLSPDKDNAFFAGGVYDGVSTKLAKVADLKVISHNSVAKYRGARNTQEIGRALNVAYVLEGSVRREVGRIHLDAKLIDTRTNAHVWAEEYDRDLKDVFALQSEIAQKVADQLGADLSSVAKAAIEEPPTTDLVAYDAYLQAKDLINGITFSTRAKEDLFQAVQLLEQTVGRDSSFFQAYCQLAEAHDRIYFLGFDHTDERLKLAETVIQSVRSLRPESGETHLALAQHYYWAYGYYDRAKEELAAARRTLPNESRIPLLSGYIDRRQGHWEKSLEEMKQALELDPRNFSILQQISLTYQALHRYKEALSTLDSVLAIAPKDVSSQVRRGWVEMEWRADSKPMHTTVDAILAEDPKAAPVFVYSWLGLALRERDSTAAERALAAMPPGGCYEESIPFPNSWCEGLAARLRGDEPAAHDAFTRARRELEQSLRNDHSYAQGLCALGVIDAALGNKEDAIREGERAVELIPVRESAIQGPMLIRYLAVIYAWTDNKDRAIERLAEAAKLPGSQMTYGYLRLHPLWDPLRGDPRFEAIAASLAPK